MTTDVFENKKLQGALHRSPQAASAFVVPEFVLNKRLCVPKWWVASHLADVHGEQEHWRAPMLPSLGAFLVIEVWHRIASLVRAGEGHSTHFSTVLELKDKELRSLQKVLSSQELYWASPFRLVRKTNEYETVLGSKTFVERLNVQYKPAGLTLDLHFTVTLEKLCSGTALGVKEIGKFVSLSPDLLFKSSQVAKVFECLKFEYERSQKRHREDFQGVGFTALAKQHKALLRSSRLLYEHGMLGWQYDVPLQSLSSLRSKGEFRKGECVSFRNFSDFALGISSFEESLSSLKPEVAQTITQNGAEAGNKEPKEREPKPRQLKSKVVEAAKDEDSGDVQFLNQISAFYESLTPLQRQSFERERKRMSPEQFQRYVMPILKSRH